MSSSAGALVSPLHPHLLTSTPPSTRCGPKSRRRHQRLGTAQSSYMDPPPLSLDRLSPELVALVCEQLRDIDYQSLFRLGRVSARFNAVSTPIAYRTLELNEELVRDGAHSRYPAAFQHIAHYTKHVVIRGSLNPLAIRRVLLRTCQISTITWRFEVDELEQDGVWLPSDVLDLQRMETHGTKLFVENLPMRQFDKGSYIKAIPSGPLVSLKLASPTPPLTTRLASLKRLLLRSRNLEVLHYQDRGQGTQLSFDAGERMPPLRELSLRSYDWNHSGDEVMKHWDFSRLTSLELISVPYYNFLSSVPLSELSSLTSLHIDDWSAHLLDRRREATHLLHDLIRYHVKELKSLEITCHIGLFHLDAISRHGRSLQRLRLRDHVGFGDENRRCPTLQPATLARLARSLPILHTLELDMDVRRCDPEQFLRALLRFPRLDTLTLHIQTVVSTAAAEDDNLPRTDQDYHAAMTILGALARERERERERERDSPDRGPWKQITINVGGWRPVMIRRLSPTWRELNEHGIFAERCFVMDRVRGQYIVREEMSVESSSRKATPDP